MPPLVYKHCCCLANLGTGQPPYSCTSQDAMSDMKSLLHWLSACSAEQEPVHGLSKATPVPQEVQRQGTALVPRPI